MLKIYGASDDLVEIEGDIREEFSSYDEPKVLACSDGTVIQMAYDQNGIWRAIKLIGGDNVKIDVCLGDGSGEDYSDIVTIDADIKWVVGGEFKAKK